MEHVDAGSDSGAGEAVKVRQQKGGVTAATDRAGEPLPCDVPEQAQAAPGARGKVCVQPRERHQWHDEDLDCKFHHVGSSSDVQGSMVPHSQHGWFACLGMADTAANGWAKQHVNPLLICGIYLLADTAGLLCNTYEVLMAPPQHYLFIIPQAIGTTFHAPIIAGMYRCGPNFATSSTFKCLMVPWSLGQLTAGLVAFLGPVDKIPTGNLLQYTVVKFIGTSLLTVGSCAGRVEGDWPAIPRTSVTPILIKAITSTLRVMDPLTDGTMIRVLLSEVDKGCWWFGTPSQCRVFVILASVLGACALADFVLIVYTGVRGSAGLSRRKTLAIHTLTLLCELGVMVTTLLSLFSSFHNPQLESGEGHKKRNEVAFTFASIAVSLLSFMLSVYGTRNAMAAAAKVATRVSRALSMRGSRASTGQVRGPSERVSRRSFWGSRASGKTSCGASRVPSDVSCKLLVAGLPEDDREPF